MSEAPERVEQIGALMEKDDPVRNWWTVIGYVEEYPIRAIEAVLFMRLYSRIDDLRRDAWLRLSMEQALDAMWCFVADIRFGG